MMQQGLAEFRERVKRIENPQNKSYYDQETKMHIPKHLSKSVIKKQQKANTISLGSMLSSLMFGAGCLVLAQLIRFRFLGMVESNDATLYTDVLFVTVILLTLAPMLGYKRLMHVFAQVAGVVLMIAGVHNLMWFEPEKLAVVYTPAYVEIIQNTTTPNTLIFRDKTFGL